VISATVASTIATTKDVLDVLPNIRALIIVDPQVRSGGDCDAEVQTSKSETAGGKRRTEQRNNKPTRLSPEVRGSSNLDSTDHQGTELRGRRGVAIDAI
jgi:hypothetical protein